MPIIIPSKIKNMVERYILASNRRTEVGGYFFGSNDVFKGFLPIPNYADNPTCEYSLGNTRGFAENYGKMLGEPIIGHLHTHPNGTIISEQDGKAAAAMPYPYSIMVSDKGQSFDWYAMDRGMRGVSIVNNDAEIEVYTEAICAEASLEYLGQVFLTPKGEVIGKPVARKFLTIDQDAYRFEKWLKNRESWRKWSYAEASRALGISAERVKKVHLKLEAMK
jgi:proteasome lid subunit RPN8/RPN11